MKKTIAVLLALMLCAGCALAEDNGLTGTWVVEKMEPKEEFVSGNRLEISFTEQDRMSFSAFESFRYESDESSLTLTAADFGLHMIVPSLLGEKVDYTYEFLSPDKLLLTSEKRQYAYLLERKSGTDGFEGLWTVVQNLSKSEMEQYLADPEGYAEAQSAEMVIDLGLKYALEFFPDGTGYRILTLLECDYAASDGTLSYTQPLYGSTGETVTETIGYRFEDDYLVLTDTETHEEDGEIVTETTLVYCKRAS